MVIHMEKHAVIWAAYSLARTHAVRIHQGMK